MRAGALLFCLPLTALAADWVKLPTPDANIHWYDRSKLLVEDDAVTYWRLVEFRTPQQTKFGMASSAMYRERIDCRNHTYRALGYLLYAKDNTVIENVHSPDAAAEPVIPETVGDRYERLMCALAAERAAAKAQASAAPPAPRTSQEIRSEMDALEARLRLLRDQLDQLTKAQAPPEPPAPANEAR